MSATLTKTDLLRWRRCTQSGSKVYQRQERTKAGSSRRGWKYPPDDINCRIINPILCLRATNRLHASMTLSNPRVSIRKKKKPWNIFLGMVSGARHEIFIMRERSHNRGGGVRGFDLQSLRRLNHTDQFLPSVATRKLTLTLPGHGKKEPSVISAF